MNQTVRNLMSRYYADAVHPYQLFERRVRSLLTSDSQVLLDAGCGRTVPVLQKFLGTVDRLIGVELVDFTDVPDGIETYRTDLANLPLPDGCVDVIMSRSVFEHLTDPDAVYAEFARVLKPGGSVVFLTANMWDYGTLVARMIPNRFHARIVKHVEGRQEEDTFPTAYRTNTRRTINRLASNHGLRITQFDYISQYPNYLMFSGVLFWLGTMYERLISRIEGLRFLRGWLLVTLQKT